jgi:CheY-like chemotaxis protein
MMDGNIVVKSRPDEGASLFIVAMTANAFREDVKRAFVSGTNGHLAKPIDIDALIQVLSENWGIRFLFSSPTF